MNIRKFLRPFLDVQKIRKAPSAYKKYIRDWLTYKNLPGSEPLTLADAYPCLFDNTQSTAFDAHYLYQTLWAFKSIHQSRPHRHVDIGSHSFFVGLTSAITKVMSVDLRPLILDITNYSAIKGDILTLPFRDNSIHSLSCLHVAEHIGLGRYGDSLDPQGTERAMKELQRILAKGGTFYLSLPVGRQRVCFNAHRIYSPDRIISSLPELSIQEFSGVDDKGRFRSHILPDNLENEAYACGLFRFTK